MYAHEPQALGERGPWRACPALGRARPRTGHRLEAGEPVDLVAMLFVLLAADVRLMDVFGLGWRGVGTIAVLMFVVRPLGVALCTRGSDLTTKERAFIAWLGPRGIVAAAVASVFAQQLESAGVGDGLELRALVFLVIAVTVSVQGLSSGYLASALGLRRRSNSGYAIVGANALGRALGPGDERCGGSPGFGIFKAGLEAVDAGGALILNRVVHREGQGGERGGPVREDREQRVNTRWVLVAEVGLGEQARERSSLGGQPHRIGRDGDRFGGGVAPYIAGGVADRYGLPSVLYVALTGVALGIVVCLFLRETAPRRAAATVAAS